MRKGFGPDAAFCALWTCDFVSKTANRPKLLSYCLLGFRRKDLETGVG